MGGVCDRLKLSLKLLRLAHQFVKAKLGTQLDAGQQLEHAVVQLTGDTPPLFLNRCHGRRAPEADFAVPFVFQSVSKSIFSASFKIGPIVYREIISGQ
jgi:hypothetical protein